MSIKNANPNQNKTASCEKASLKIRSLKGPTFVGVIAGSALAVVWLTQNGSFIHTSNTLGKSNDSFSFIGRSTDSGSRAASAQPDSGVELTRLVSWGSEISTEFDRLSLKQQIHRVRNDILPELDRLEHVLISSESHWKSASWSKQLQVIDQVRSSFSVKLSELERQLHRHGGDK